MAKRLSEITAAVRSDVLPGYVLSPPRLREWGEAEEEAAQRYLSTVRNSVDGLSAEVQIALMQLALEKVANGAFGMGMPALDAFLKSASATSFGTWLCLKVKHPQLTREGIPPLVGDDREVDVSRAVLELWGFLPSSKKKTAKRLPLDPLTGPTSSPTSAPSTDSASPKSST